MEKRLDLADDLVRAREANRRRELIAQLVAPQLLILDEFGMKSLRGTDTEDILEVHRRHGTTSTVVATNRPVADWGAFLGDAAAASAILDRLLGVGPGHQPQGSKVTQNKKPQDRRRRLAIGSRKGLVLHPQVLPL
ncbi:MAG: ATP-binding protein [Fibrobacteres bacterium]|nr:ATP-binding protein [Fibrobacterota bacterium]